MVITVVATILLLCAYLARWVDPNTVWLFAFAGMAAPILYVVNFVLALYWVLRWRWFALLPGVALVLGIGWVSLFFKPVFGRHHTPPDKATTVMTYNVAGFVNNGRTSTLDSIAAQITRERPDLLCIQEFQCVNDLHKARIDSLMGMQHSVHSFSIANTSGGGLGLAIYSRWRILDSGTVAFEHTANSAMWADVVAGNDTLRIFNCHLQSTSVSKSDVEYVEDIVNDESVSRTRNIASKLRRGFRIRATQVDTLAPLIRQSPHKVIVCGDFNDTPMSYAYAQVRGRLADAFVESGHGAPNTYNGLFNLLRIDYILHSRKLRTVSYTTLPSDYSDHKPVVAGLRI